LDTPNFDASNEINMAKLLVTKEKYGVPVSARIDPVLALKISEDAQKLDISMARMVGTIIARGMESDIREILENNEEIDKLSARINEIESELKICRSDFKRFRDSFATYLKQTVRDENKIKEHIQIFKSINGNIFSNQTD